MAQPPAYNRLKDFTLDGQKTDNPALNGELDHAATSINELRNNLAILQADDGTLRQYVVTPDSISPELKIDLVNSVVIDATGMHDRALAAAEAAETSVNEAKASETAALESQNAAAQSETVAVESGQSALASRNAAAESRTVAETAAQQVTSALTDAKALYGDLNNINSAVISASESAASAAASAVNASQSSVSASISKTAAALSESNAVTAANLATEAADTIKIDESKLSAAVSSAAASADNAAESAEAAARSAEQAAGGQINADWHANTGKAQILNKPDLSQYANNTLSNIGSCPDFSGYEYSTSVTGDIDLNISSPNFLHLKTSGNVQVTAVPLANEVSKEITISAKANSNTAIQWPASIQWTNKSPPEWGQASHTLVIVIWFVGGNIIGSTLYNSEKY